MIGLCLVGIVLWGGFWIFISVALNPEFFPFENGKNTKTANQRKTRGAVEANEANEANESKAYVYGLRDEAAYLESDDGNDDGKLEIAERTPEPAPSKCWFCWKSREQVRMLFGAKYPVRDPNNFSNETLIYICDECVAKFAERVAGTTPRAAIGIRRPGFLRRLTEFSNIVKLTFLAFLKKLSVNA